MMNSVGAFVDRLTESVKSIELPSFKKAETVGYTCLLVGRSGGLDVAAQKITDSSLNLTPLILDDPASLRSLKFQVVVLMIDVSDPSCAGLIHQVAKELLEMGVHRSRVTKTIQPGEFKAKPKDYAKMLTFLDKHELGTQYWIENGDGVGVVRALTKLFDPELNRA